jgi:transcriptional regulator of aromatic amino acid metabolism
VTTTSVRLFPLVMSGAFLAALYYRLNVIYVEV